jgi:hypothetical protein
VWCHGTRKSTYAPPEYNTLTDLIHDNDTWAIAKLHCPRKGANIAAAMIKGTAVAVCDGSYKDLFGTAGYVFQHWDSKEERVIGAHVTPGHSSEINPYRSKLGGILALVVVAEAIATFHDVQAGTIELGCDCESGIIAIFEHTYDTPKQPHHDLIHEIRKKLEASRLTWKFRHVRGHQDKHLPYNLLDMWEQMNVEMDSLAKTYWNETSSSTTPFYPLSAHGWSLWVGPRKLSSWYRTSLYNHCQSHDILAHWSNRRAIPANLIHTIDWDACQDAVKKLGLNRSLWVPKWLAGFAPVGKVLQRNKLQTHAECPRCAAFENTAHVLLCPAPNATRQWDKSLANLRTWLTQARTMPDLANAIINRLRSWRSQTAPTPPTYNWPGVNDLILAQDSIGWRAFLEGAVLIAWAEKQQEYLVWLKRRNTGKRWVTTLIKKLWEISWDLWEQQNGELTNPASPASLREHARLGALIALDFQDQTTLATRDRRWFRRPKQVLFTETSEYKEQWLESVRLARAKYARRHKTSTHAQCSLMQSTFCRTRQQPPSSTT